MKHKINRGGLRFGVLSLLALAGVAQAGPVIAPQSPPVNLTPPAIADLGPSEMQVFPQNSALSDMMDELHPLQWGPVTLRPHANYSFSYNTGIQSSTNQSNDSIVQTLSPGCLFVLGKHWTLDYTPTITFYSDKNLKDSVGHAVSLTGGTAYEDWVFGFSQGFTYTDSPQSETGTQTSQENFNTSLTAAYQINSEFSTDLAVNQNLAFTSGFQNTREWSTIDWLNYQVFPRLSFGVGAGGGYTEATPNSTKEELRGRVNWRATDKISFSVNGGAEFTQFTDGGAKPLVNPVYSGSIEYLPWKQTQVSIGASRAVSASYYQNQVSESTSVNGGISQTFLKRFNFNVNSAYNWTTYVAAANGASANSGVDYWSLNAQLSTSVFKRGTISIFYNYSENITTQPGLGYNSTQVGFNLGYAF
jgi:hypothetical protein